MMNTRHTIHIPTKQTLDNGEPFLTIRQFHVLLSKQGIPGSLRNLYRWLDVPKEFLPIEIRTVLDPAPAIWFKRLDPQQYRGHKQHTIAIPVRYLTHDIKTQYLHLEVVHVEPHLALRTLCSLQNNMVQMQHDIDRLTRYCQSLIGKDTSNVQHTDAHSLTA